MSHLMNFSITEFKKIYNTFYVWTCRFFGSFRVLVLYTSFDMVCHRVNLRISVTVSLLELSSVSRF